MKSTGIIRRIDDLGRVVIPKEIRRNMGIREGDPLEAFLNEDVLILQKYNEVTPYIKRIKDIISDMGDDNGFKYLETIELLNQAQKILRNVE